MIDTYNSLFLIFLNFTIISVLTTLMKFSALLTIMESPRPVVTKKLKLGMQSLSYVGPSTWNKLLNNLKTANSVNYFKHDIKKYFLKGETEVNIYSYA